jgi:hypothetical protein
LSVQISKDLEVDLVSQSMFQKCVVALICLRPKNMKQKER